MSIRFTFCLALLFLSITLKSQNQPLIDSLLVKLKTAEEDTNKINILNNLSECYAGFKIQKKFIDKSLSIAISLKFIKGEITALRNLGIFYDNYYGDKDSSAFFFEKAIDLCKRTNNFELLAFNYRELALHISEYNRPKEKINYLKQSILLFEHLNNKKELPYSSIELAHCYVRLNKTDSAYLLVDKMIKMAKAGKNSVELFTVLKYYCEIRNKAVDLSISDEYYRKSESILKSIENTMPLNFDVLVQVSWLYSDFAEYYDQINKFDSVLKYSVKTFEYTEKIKKIKPYNWQYFYITQNIYNRLIYSYCNQKQFFKADVWIQKAVSDYKNPLNRLELFNFYNNVAGIFSSCFLFDRSLFYYKEAMRIAMKIGEEKFINRNYFSIATQYEQLGYYRDAADAYLHYIKKLGANRDIIQLFGANAHLAYEYIKLGNADSAIYYNDIAFDLIKKWDNLFARYFVLNNYSLIYELKKDYQKAIDYNLMMLKLERQSKIPNYRYAPIESNLARVYLRNGEIDKALLFAINGLPQSVELSKPENGNFKEYERDDYLTLYEIYKKFQKSSKALEYFEKYNSLKDEIGSEKSKKAFQLAQMNEISEKNSLVIKSFQQKYLAQGTKMKLQKQILYLLLTGSILLIALLIFAFHNFIQKEKALQILESQKDVILQKNEELTLFTEEISSQRDLLAQHQKDITASLEYASLIQHALLSSEEILKCKFSEYFILYKPRDIISGDFYWFKQIKNFLFVVVADCTGHGVPGAFMSVLGISLLNDIVGKRGLDTPAEMLNELRKRLKKSLKQDFTEIGNHDGMDIAFCRIDLETLEMQYAGANNPLFLVHNNELFEYPADRMPVGVYPKDKNDFTNQKIQLKPNDLFYIFSDGYISQFGGKNGKKFNFKRFKQLLVEVSSQPLEIQKQILNQKLIEWQRDFDQIDDILVVGVRV